jgi:hypothetical protein
MADPKIPGAVLLGPGKSRRYWKPEYEDRLLEEDGETWLLPKGFFCEACDGSGCKACKWTGEEAKRQELRKARAARKRRAKLPNRAAASSGGGGLSPAPPTGVGSPDTEASPER